MRTNAILQAFRQLPPKVQLGLAGLAAVVFAILWLTGNLPREMAGDSSISERGRLEQERTATSVRRDASRPSDSAEGKSPARSAGTSRASSRSLKGEAGDYDYLSLALSWSPTYCETTGRRRNEQQCSGNRAYAFVVHGLWPQYNKGWPENCAVGQKPYVPNDVIRSMLDIMPSRGLIIHEYKKHGTCAGLGPKGYFSLTRKLYQKVRIPPRYVRPEQAIRTSPREIENDFLRANPGMTPDMISIVCGRGERLEELRICFSREGKMTSCGRNENQKKLCSRGRIRIPPVRERRRS